MKKAVITLKNKKYNIHFGMEALVICGEKWGLSSLNKVQQYIEEVSANPEGEEGELTLKAIKMLRDLFHTSLSVENPDFPFTPYELMDYLMFEDSKALGELMAAYTKSQGQKEPTDPNVRKGRKK